MLKVFNFIIFTKVIFALIPQFQITSKIAHVRLLDYANWCYATSCRARGLRSSDAHTRTTSSVEDVSDLDADELTQTEMTMGTSTGVGRIKPHATTLQSVGGRDTATDHQ